MTAPSFRDVEQLSSFLDGQLPQAERARLESRIQADPELAAALVDLRQARAVLRRTPKRRLPRNFTLTPRMAGIKPPLPRLVPALSWASAAAMLLFIFTLGSSLLSHLSFGAAAPMAVSAPSAMGGGSETEVYGIGGGPTTDQNTTQFTPTPEITSLQQPAPTTAPNMRTVEPPPNPKNAGKPLNPWLFIWPGLAGLTIGAALLIRWIGMKKFRERVKSLK